MSDAPHLSQPVRGHVPRRHATSRPIALSRWTILLGAAVGFGAGIAFGAGAGLLLTLALLAAVVAFVTWSRPEFAVVALIIVLPLAGNVAITSMAGLPDLTVGRLLAGWAFVVVLAAIRRQSRSTSDGASRRHRRLELVSSAIPIWATLLLMLTLIAALRGPELQAGLQSWLDDYMVPIGALVLVTRYGWSRREVRILVAAYLMNCALWSALAIAESLLGRSFFVAGGDLTWASSADVLARTGGPFINPAFLGTALGLGLVLAFVWAGQGGRLNRLAMVALPILFLGLLVTLTRASWLGATGGALAALASGSGRRRVLRISIAFAGLAVGLLVVASLIGASPLESRTTSTSEIYNRLIVQRAAVSIIADHPLAGVGSDRFAQLSRSDLRNVGEISASFGAGTLVPHNSVLSASVDGGLFAGASLVVLFGLLLFAAVRLSNQPGAEAAGAAAVGCVVVFVLNALFIDIFLGAAVTTLSLTVIGILLSPLSEETPVP